MRQRFPVIAILAVLAACGANGSLAAQRPIESAVPRGGGSAPATLDAFERDRLRKAVSDLTLFALTAKEMVARKVQYSGPGGMAVPAYFFSPLDTGRRRPVVLLIHGGIHADFSAGYAGTVRALVRRGYIVVAPDYRGSTGYGRAHYDGIDYGGLEVEDCIAAIDWLAAAIPYADTSRVGIFGWSHGGFIAVHAVLRQPQRFRVAVAHVPVADLPARIRTHSEAYHQLFITQPGFGDRLEANPAPYVERSLTTHARKLRTPLLVHAADNDDDVFIIENHILRDSMVAAGMDRSGLYTYREWRNPPGGHSFSVMDTPQGRESWRETVRFLGRFLRPRDTVRLDDR